MNEQKRNMRALKTKKRGELRAVVKAFEAFVYGCADTPLRSGEVGRVLDELRAMTEKLSIKQWGR
jgi:hypothetical protein